MTTRRFDRWCVVFVAALMVGACASPGEKQEGSSPVDGSTEQREPLSAREWSAEAERALERRGESDAGGGEVTDRPDVAYGIARERVVEACMREAGFEWRAGEFEETVRAFETRRPGGAAAADDVFGFGISTEQETLAATGFRYDAPVADANAAAVAGLGPAEQQAYRDEQMRCHRRAQTEVPVPDELDPASAERSRQMQDRLNELVAADPRVVAAQQQWRSCMVAAGFDFPTKDDLLANLVARTEAAKAGMGEPLAVLQAFERQAAVANRVCEAPVVAAHEQASTEHLARLAAGG